MYHYRYPSKSYQLIVNPTPKYAIRGVLQASIINTFQTGPKGVMEDWRRYKQLQAENRQEQKDELAKLAKQLTLAEKVGSLRLVLKKLELKIFV